MTVALIHRPTSFGPPQPGRTVSLTDAGFGEFHLNETTVADRPGAQLDCARRDTGRVWAVRQYLVVSGDASYCLGLGSALPADDRHHLDAVCQFW